MKVLASVKRICRNCKIITRTTPLRLMILQLR
ncbi:50S ribosomal protein L36, partial [Cupriavidus sp. TA19]